MLLLRLLLAWATLAAVGIASAAEPPRDEKELGSTTALDEKLRQELLDRMQNDQAARKDVLSVDAIVLEEMKKTDRENTAWLKTVVDRHGWPGKAMVGEDGAEAAWLLVQHADHDLAFQKKCLELLKAAVKKQDAAPQNMAYLIDRVSTGEKMRQVYGTQLRVVDGKVEPTPIEDEEHVDDRRKAVGLSPLREYLKTAQAALSPVNDEP